MITAVTSHLINSIASGKLRSRFDSNVAMKTRGGLGSHIRTSIKLKPIAMHLQNCNNPYNIHSDAKIHITSRARPRGAIHLGAPPRRRGEPARKHDGGRERGGDTAIRAAAGSAVRSNRMVNTSLARYCTLVAGRWPREIAGQMKQPPCGTRRQRRASFTRYPSDVPPSYT